MSQTAWGLILLVNFATEKRGDEKDTKISIRIERIKNL
jgi:hypothetical protein